MRDLYLDNPMSIEKYIDGLGDRDSNLFDRGYLVAVLAILEHISDFRAEFLNKQLSANPEEERKLLPCIRLLDALEAQYSRRANNLENHLQRQTLHQRTSNGKEVSVPNKA